MIDLSKIYKTRDGRRVKLFTPKERLIYGISDDIHTMIDLSKKYTTRKGLKVTIYSIDLDLSEEYPVIGKIEGNQTVQQWSLNGEYYKAISLHDADLIEVKEKKILTGFVNIYSSHTSGIHKSIIDAERVQLDGIIARKQITIEYEEGEGL
jgi:hypothetical protein